jgi:lipoate-protein ligase A
LCFVRPRQPYVCLGFHRDLNEVDASWCAEQGLPVYRRMVGGGPVYLDDEQVFFQIVLPAAEVRGSRTAALREMLRPAEQALQSLGVPVRLDEYGELSLFGAKVCGHGAGQIRDGVVIVGNLLLGFDHSRAARILALTPGTRRLVTDLMRRHISSTPVPVDAWREAMVRAYAEHLGGGVLFGELGEAELQACLRYDVRLSDLDFVAGRPGRPGRALPVRTVKVRAGVWVHSWREADGEVVLAVADGHVVSAVGIAVADLVGAPVAAARDHLRARDCAVLATAMERADTEVAAA